MQGSAHYAASANRPRGTMMTVCRNCGRFLPLTVRHVALVRYTTTGTALISRNYITSTDKTKFDKENILTVPNLLSVSRIALSPALGYLVLSENYPLALGLFAVAGITDMMDGYIARNFKGQSSMLGSVLDPLADKVLISVLTVTLTVGGLLPVPLAVLILGKDGLLVSGSFYLRYITLPSPRTWSRYWDIQRSTVQVTPTFLGKVNTLLQLMLVGLSLAAPIVDMVGHVTLQALWFITGATTFGSGVTYLYQMRGFKVLKTALKQTK